jgi:lipopolysaccharide transport system ATP-binding protein
MREPSFQAAREPAQPATPAMPAMPTTPAIIARDLTKTYRVYARPWDRFRELIVRRPNHRGFHAVQGVSFDLAHGEGLALIGENGAGKSTLLKMLAGITAPTSGALEVAGKVASILELGSGFHPEFTGRQNVVLNAAMLGLSEEEVQRKMPDILAFSELGDFIDRPVKTYSTGMSMRLGFSIATQVEPDVLIIDEALSVGDGYFQKKCMDRLLQFVEGGGTLLFCSHAMYYVSAFCQRALWMRQGKAEALGPVLEVIREYEDYLLTKTAPETPASAAAAEAGSGSVKVQAPASAQSAAWPARILDGRVLSEVGSGGLPLCRPGEPFVLAAEWEARDPSTVFHLGVGINRVDGVEIFSFATHLDGMPPQTGRRRYSARLCIPALPLVKGKFAIYLFLLDEEGLHVYDQRLIQPAFQVESPAYAFGLLDTPHTWELEAVQETRAAVPSEEAAARRWGTRA